ncbi:MAG: MFS transporter [Deltaproteobacteria bacterium]|nr:MAG: MFS transporter [Deltaproteobacteria bacterium]
MQPTQSLPDRSPFSIGNIRLFIAFRIFFNARFYYPIFTILYLDYGLTLEQFALLNVVWAATIVLLEVPSGALADTIGRKNLLVFAGILMVIEMVLLCVVPAGYSKLLFAVFLINRVLSGTAEAAASGADEALAYDSLEKEGNIDDWGRVLEKQMRLQSIAYIGAMTLGAAVYDPVLMQKIAHWLGLKVVLTQSVTLRFPIYLTLGMALMALISTICMKEITPSSEACPEPSDCTPSIGDAFRMTFQAGKWILKTPFALVIIAAGFLFDHVIRMLLTLNSQYYREIQLPEASFGLIGSAIALIGLVIPRLSLYLAENQTPGKNLGILFVVTLSGLIGMTFFFPYIGVIPAMMLSSAMMMTHFFVSHYLNRITPSHQRATVLSFKGLSYNLTYGCIGLLYSFLLATLKTRAAGTPGRTSDPKSR